MSDALQSNMVEVTDAMRKAGAAELPYLPEDMHDPEEIAEEVFLAMIRSRHEGNR